MIKVLMNGIELNGEFATKEDARKYVSTAKKIDKKYGEKHVYKVVVL